MKEHERKNNYIFGDTKFGLQKYNYIQKIKCILLHIIMISEGSCDTEDWSNDAEIQLYSLTDIHIENSILNNNKIIFHYFLLYFDQMNAALVSKRDFQKHSCRQNLAQ